MDLKINRGWLSGRLELGRCRWTDQAQALLIKRHHAKILKLTQPSLHRPYAPALKKAIGVSNDIMKMVQRGRDHAVVLVKCAGAAKEDQRNACLFSSEAKI